MFSLICCSVFLSRKAAYRLDNDDLVTRGYRLPLYELNSTIRLMLKVCTSFAYGSQHFSISSPEYKVPASRQ
ncbi:hypothetical protein A0J61_01690 [Choanephora cucurbitarum]|uniref:Uncharacterized protein n=1 Tax=Choanephora cucurbitarum TaxID=101091 RepID=A0A1C7NME1_9FUNG|nr:hypothetical protein A0J61_01690 [Choanephora cucurbitarum]